MKHLHLLFALLLPVLLFGQPANDDCINAEVLTFTNNVANFSVDLTTATTSGISPTCQNNPKDVWYTFTMPINGNLVIAGSTTSEFAVYESDMSNCIGTQLSCNGAIGFTFQLVQGQTYVVQAYHPFGTDVTLNTTLTAHEQITNDDCNSAATLNFDGNNQASDTPQSNGATISGQSPACENNPRDVWYKFTMPFDGNVLVTGSSNVEYAFYESDVGNCFGTELSCLTGGNHTFNLVGGQEYLLQAFRINGTRGTFNFTITATPTITNDDCISAETLAFDMNDQASAAFNTNGATISGNDPSCENNARDGWYKFTMPFDGNVLVTGSSNVEYAFYETDVSNCLGAELACLFGGNHVFNLVNGQEYLMQVFRINGTDGNLNFTITATPSVSNDDCQTAATLLFDGNNQSSDTFDTNGATISGNDPSCENNARDGWYRFTMPFDGNMLVTGSSNVEYAFYETDAGNCFGAELACLSGGNHVFGLTGGQEYLLQVFRINGTDGILNFTLTATQTLTNDTCQTAEVLTFDMNNEANGAFDTNGASISGNDPSCETNTRDGWYKVTMPFDGNLKISGSSNTEYAVYDTDAVNCFNTELFCVTNGRFAYALNAGQEYLIQAYRINGTDGNMSFTATAYPQLPNDDCAGAETIEVATIGNCSSTQVTVNLNQATDSGLTPSCDTAGINHDVWYTFESPVTGNINVDTNSSFERFAVYDACSGTEIECFSGDGTITGLQFGQTYWLQVWRNDNVSNTITFCLEGAFEVAPGTANTCENLPNVTIDNASGNTNQWVPILDASSRIVAAINANGNELGSITSSLFIDSNDTRSYNGQPYLRREVNITPAFQPATNVTVRIYMLRDEVDDLILADSNLDNVNGLGMMKTEDVACSGGYSGGMGDFINTSEWPYSNEYYSQFNVNSFSTFYPSSTNLSPTLGLESSIERSTSLHPNPASTEFWIHNNQHLTISSISIFSLTGKELLSVSVENDAEAIDISQLPSGLYFVRIQSEAIQFTKKLIVE